MKYVIVLMECYEDPIEAIGLFDTEEQAQEYAQENIDMPFSIVPFKRRFV